MSVPTLMSVPTYYIWPHPSFFLWQALLKSWVFEEFQSVSGMFLKGIWTGFARFNGFFKSQERSPPKNVLESNFLTIFFTQNFLYPHFFKTNIFLIQFHCLTTFFCTHKFSWTTIFISTIFLDKEFKIFWKTNSFWTKILIWPTQLRFRVWHS